MLTVVFEIRNNATDDVVQSVVLYLAQCEYDELQEVCAQVNELHDTVEIECYIIA